jgi:hypothetical protein
MFQVLLAAARAYAAAGFAVLPIRPTDKQPAPGLLPKDAQGRRVWAPFQHERPDDAWLERWFGASSGSPRDLGIAVICGRISGGAEALDFDHHPLEHPHLFDEWAELVRAEAPGLLERLVIVETQHGGRHAWYRCPVVGSNLKLVQAPIRDRETGKPGHLTRIETRGEGGYAAVPPTAGYTLLQGALTELPTLTLAERELLHRLARTFQAVQNHGAPRQEGAKGERPGGADLRPGDDYNRRTNLAHLAALLTRHGWTVTARRGDVLLLRRPGKEHGVSATLGHIPGKLFVFSTNAYPFADGRAYDAFCIYALLEHGGDWGAAARALAAGGYGAPAARPNHRPGAKTEADAAARHDDGGDVADAEGQAEAAPGQLPPEPDDVEAVLTALAATADRGALEDLLPELTERCAVFARPALLRIDRVLRKRGLPQEQVRTWHAALNEVRAARRRAAAAMPTAALPASWPYEAAEGRLWLLALNRTPGGAEVVTRTPIADFSACVQAEEVTQGEREGGPGDADGGRWFHVKGHTISGQLFGLRLSAEILGDPRVLRTAFIRALGAAAVIYPRMEAHLGVALLKCAPQPPRVIRRYERLGWTAADGFVIPGCLPPDVTLAPVEAPYRLDSQADPARGQAAVAALLCSHDVRRTTVAAMAAFTPALARPAGWHRLRYALFVAGATGSLKTSWCMALMGLWGREFTEGHGFTKFGERGGSIVAVLGAAAVAGDLPLFIDNYKPQIAGASNEFVALVAALLEGDDKQRLERTGERLRRRRAVTAWPLITGEDAPGDDASTLARTLIVPFEWRPGALNRALTEAQGQAEHLSALGLAWVRWLASPEGQAAAWSVRSDHGRLRDEWLQKLVAFNPQMVNPARVASHLAVNQLTYWAVCQHPLLRPVCKPYEADHRAGLELIAAEMALRTQEASEGERFLAALRELVGRDTDDGLRYVLLRRGADGLPAIERGRFLGWYDEHGVYLLPGQARAAVEQARGRDYLGGLSDQTLHAQLARQGCIASHEKGRHQQQIFVRGVKQRVLHLVTEALFPPAP